MTDAQWEILAPLLPPAKPGGRPRSVDLREALNSVLYALRSGCPCRMLPHDLPPWQTVYQHFRRWSGDGTWERINGALRPMVRKAVDFLCEAGEVCLYCLNVFGENRDGFREGLETASAAPEGRR